MAPVVEQERTSFTQVCPTRPFHDCVPCHCGRAWARVRVMGVGGRPFGTEKVLERVDGSGEGRWNPTDTAGL